MTEVDASIPLSVRPVQLDNPMDVQAKALQLKNLGIQTQQAQQDYDDSQTIRSIYAKNVDPTTGELNQAGFARDGYAAGVGAKVQPVLGQFLANKKTQADIAETNAKGASESANAAKSQWDLHVDQLNRVNNHIAALATDPNLTRDKVLDTISSEIQDPDARARALASVPQDPAKLKDYLFTTGIKNFDAMRQIETEKARAPTQVTADTGNAIQYGNRDPITGQVTMNGPTVAKTMTPDEAAKIQLQQSGGLTDDAKQLAVDRLLQGEPANKVLGNLGRGAQGSRDLRDIQNLLANTAKARGIDASGILSATQGVVADNREATVLGNREGSIAPRVQEAANFAQIAKQASADVPRGSFIPYNKLSQMADTQISDPALAKLKAATVSLINAYAGAVGGGTVHVHDQETAEKLLSAAQSPEAYNAVVDQLLTETKGALAAPGQVRAGMGIGSKGNPTGAAPANAPGTPPGARPPLDNIFGGQ